MGSSTSKEKYPNEYKAAVYKVLLKNFKEQVIQKLGPDFYERGYMKMNVRYIIFYENLTLSPAEIREELQKNINKPFTYHISSKGNLTINLINN